MNFSFTRFAITIAAAVFLGLLTVYAPSLRYAGGLMLLLFLIGIFVTNLSVFMFGLLFLRPAIDNFLTSIRFAFGGLNLGFGGGVSLAISLGAFFYALTCPKSYRIGLPVVIIYGAFCFFSIFGFMMATEKGEAVKVLLRSFSILSILILMVCHITSSKDAHFIVKSMVYSPWIPIAIGAYTRFKSGGGRFAATFSHPNILAFFILIIMGCLIFRLDQEGGFRKISFKRLVVLILLSVILVLTETRSGWAAFLLMVIIYAFVFNRRLIVPMVILMAILFSTPLVRNKIDNIFRKTGSEVSINDQSSLGWRFTAWRDLWNAGQDNPILGHGINASYGIVKEHLGAHNDYLRYFVEQGLIGLITYFAPFFYVLFHSISNVRRFPRGSMLEGLAGLFICFIPAFLLMSMTENLASYVIVQWYFWALVGIYFALIQTEKEKEFNNALAFGI